MENLVAQIGVIVMITGEVTPELQKMYESYTIDELEWWLRWYANSGSDFAANCSIAIGRELAKRRQKISNERK